MSFGIPRGGRRRLIVAGLLVGTALSPVAALAQDATWTGSSDSYGNNSNWTPGTVPTNQATFDGSGADNVTTVDIHGGAINHILLEEGNEVTEFEIGLFATFRINGIGTQGITNNSGAGILIRNFGEIVFNNAASVASSGIDVISLQNPGLLNDDTATITLNDTSALLGNTVLRSTGGGARGEGETVDGGISIVAFNDSSSADGIRIFASGGSAAAYGINFDPGRAQGGTASLTFNGNSHADNAIIEHSGGSAAALAGDTAADFAIANGGISTLTFNDNSHADGASINNSSGGANATAGEQGPYDIGATADATSGSAVVTFNDTSHADNATIRNSVGLADARGQDGEAGTSGTGEIGGNATAGNSSSDVLFNDNSHADGASIENIGGRALAEGGAGGAGDAGQGGEGGSALATGTSGRIVFADASHALNATIANRGGNAESTGGSGGSSIGAAGGGDGNTALAGGGSGEVEVGANASIAGSAIANTGGNAKALGGDGGDGNAGAGGIGADSAADGGNAMFMFTGNSTAGAGTLTNTGGNAEATGGKGGNGGAGPGAGGDGGMATATGGDAAITFADTSSAGSATITNTAGTATMTSGSGGNGNFGAGGDGGSGSATAGNASIVFSDASTAGSATISNNGGTPITAVAGLPGADGGLGGEGGDPGGTVTIGAVAEIIFEDDATGGSAQIANTNANTRFADNAVFGTAAGARIVNNGASTTVFANNASLGSGAIVNNAGAATLFTQNSTAGTGAITNVGASSLTFSGTSDAGAATIDNQLGGTTSFISGSSAASATINNAAMLNFFGTSDAVGARIVNAGSGAVGIGVSDGGFNLGSLSGGGTFALGANNLDVGFLGLVDSFSGVISGTGAVVKQGTGTMILAGANTYLGGTTISAGTLQIGAGGTTGSVIGDILDNAALAFNRSDNLTFANVISGSGSLTQAGSGTLILTNDNTYLGGTTVAAGTLQIGDGGTTGSILGDVVDNAALAFNRSDTVTFGGLISGTGALTQLGAGTLILTGDNTYAGGTTISAGTLQVGAGGTTGWILGDVADNANLAFNRSDAVTFAGVVSGTGTLTKLGTGMLTLTGENTYTGLTTITAGTLQIGDGGTAGSVSGDILDNAALAFNRSNTMIYGGAISGSGTLAKLGAGTLILTGANTYTGATTVNQGVLQLLGSVTSDTTVAAGASLTGTGTVGGNLIVNGTVVPGSAAAPTGTLAVEGVAAFNGGSVLQPTITAGGSSSLLAAGALDIAGGEVSPIVATGGVFLMQTDYTVATGSAGRTGTFSGIDGTLLPAFLDASLSYSATDVNLRLRRNATDFAGASGLTANQDALAAALDDAVTGGSDLPFTTYEDLYNGLLTAAGTNAFAAQLETASGASLTAFPLAEQAAAQRFGERLARYTWSNSSNVWGLVAYADHNADSDGNGPGFGADAVEFQLGFATSLGDSTRAGISIAMSNGDVAVDGGAAHGDLDTWSVGAHLRHDFGGFYLAGQATYSWHSVDSERALVLGGVATAEFDAQTWTAAAEAGAAFGSTGFSIEPHASVRYADTSQDAYSEDGPAGGLDVAARDYQTTRLGLGLRLANRDPDAALRFSGVVRYEHETGDNTSVLDNALPGLPTFTVAGTELGDDILSAELGVEARLGEGLSMFVGGSGHVRDNEQVIEGHAGLRAAF